MATLDGRDLFIRQYVAELQDLTFNSKPLINTLTMLASENPQAAVGIAEAIERRIATSAPAHKLPALYLLDSIVKNIGLPYTALFAKELPQLYMAAWSANPDVRPSLTKLFNTWHRFFPKDILAAISERLSKPQVMQTVSHQRVQQVASYPPAQTASNQGAQFYQQSVAAPVASGWPPQYPAQQQAPYALVQQQGTALQSNGARSTASNQYAAAYTPTYPQPQYSHQSPYNGQADAPLGQQSGHGTPTYSQQQAQAGMPDILSQLISAGLIPAGKQGQGPGKATDSKAQPVVPPLVFNLSKAKDWFQLALKQLLDGTKATEAKFLDHKLHKKRKLAAGSKSSRLWFVKSSDWLAGTTADAQAAPAFFDEEQKTEDAPTEEKTSMPADPNQPNCGLSGERFETFWDDATNSWRYSDATALDAEQADKHGLAEGTLVKVSCLGPVKEARIGAASETLEAAEGQQTADEVAAAASAETDQPTLDGILEEDAAGDADDAKQKSPKKQKLS